MLIVGAKAYDFKFNKQKGDLVGIEKEWMSNEEIFY